MECSMSAKSYVAIWGQEWTPSLNAGEFWVCSLGLEIEYFDSISLHSLLPLLPKNKTSKKEKLLFLFHSFDCFKN